MLKRGRVFEKVELQKPYKKLHKSFIKKVYKSFIMKAF